MIKKFTVLLFLITVLSSCQKTCTTGTVRFTCISDNPYRLFIDGSLKTTVAGNSFIEYDLSEGTHTANVEQVSGYLIYPTTAATTLNVYGCKDSEWIFP